MMYGLVLEDDDICCFVLCYGVLRWEGVDGWLTEEETEGVRI